MSRAKIGRLEFYFWAMAALGKGLSGGDRIFIELSRRWSKKYPVTIFVWEEGYQMCQRQHLVISNIKYQISNMHPWCKFGFGVCYFARIVKAILEAIKLTINHPEPEQSSVQGSPDTDSQSGSGHQSLIINRPSTIIYSASHFWMDSLPAFILKLRYPKITWAAAWYQTAPSPLRGFKEGPRESSYRLSAFLYWLTQLPIKPLIKRYADFVLVNNEEEKKQFPRHAKEGKAMVVLGAVNLDEIQNSKFKIQNSSKVYDAVFQGRFHPQKGVVELIDIWKKVVEKKPGAKLAMIGDGPLMESVKLKIKSEKLEKNIELFGYVFDGPKKYKIFSQSKLVVHPAFYDSGGMASAEAMAFGLPCVGFNLKAYESYYPCGMVKVKTGDLKAFADEVIRLLGDRNYRERIGKEALEMIEKNWSWDKRAEEILRRMANG